MEDYIKNAKKTLTSKIKGQTRKTDAYQDFTKHLKTWTTFNELIMELIHESMIVDDDRHWLKVREILNSEIVMLPDSELDQLWALQIWKKDEAIKDIGEQSK